MTMSTLTPLPPDPVLISLQEYPGGEGIDEVTECLRGWDYDRFVLYRDGLLIVFDGTHYLAASISQTEIDQLLARIEATGFFAVGGQGDQYVQNAPTPSSISGLESSITVNGHSVEIENARIDFLTEPVKKSLDLIAGYKPSSLNIYRPERVRVWAYPIQDISFSSYDPSPEPPVLNWSSEAIQLDMLTDESQIISNAPLSFLLNEVKAIPAFRMVKQNGRYYLILICPTYD